MKLVYGLVFSIFDFCNSLYYGLPNILNVLQMSINIAARIVVGFPRFSRERITLVCIDLQVLPKKKIRIKCKICLLAYKGIECKKPLYLNEMLELREPSAISLRSNYDTWKLVENWLPDPGFTKTCFKYCAPRLYNICQKLFAS